MSQLRLSLALGRRVLATTRRYGTRVFSADPSTLLVNSIIGANVVVFGGWWYAKRVYAVERDPTLIITMRKHFWNSLESFTHGRFYTLVSSAFSHEDTIHLLVNMIALQSFGPMVRIRGYSGA